MMAPRALAAVFWTIAQTLMSFPLVLLRHALGVFGPKAQFQIFVRINLGNIFYPRGVEVNGAPEQSTGCQGTLAACLGFLKDQGRFVFGGVGEFSELAVDDLILNAVPRRKSTYYITRKADTGILYVERVQYEGTLIECIVFLRRNNLYDFRGINGDHDFTINNLIRQWPPGQKSVYCTTRGGAGSYECAYLSRVSTKSTSR